MPQAAIHSKGISARNRTPPCSFLLCFLGQAWCSAARMGKTTLRAHVGETQPGTASPTNLHSATLPSLCFDENSEGNNSAGSR